MRYRVGHRSLDSRGPYGKVPIITTRRGCANDQQRNEAEAFIKELSSGDRYRGQKIVTQVEPAKTFWPAEEYHQDYLDKTGGVCHVSNPW